MNTSVFESSSNISTIKIDYVNKVGGSGMPHYHVHNFYEISLILEGNLHFLLEDASLSGEGSFLLLTPPNAPHRVVRDALAKYERINIHFPKDLIENYVADSERLLSVFGINGKILELSNEQKERLLAMVKDIFAQKDLFRQRLLLLLYLAEIESFCSQLPLAQMTPPYIREALQFLHKNYMKKITAEQIASHVGVGRTTFMTAFKQYTGSTLNHYLTQYRLQIAIQLLKQGYTQQSSAEKCGFSDVGGFIRAFSRHYGTTPYKYLHK